MTPREIIERMTFDGLNLSVSEDGNLKILGDQNVVNSWLAAVKENKASILDELAPSACNVSVTPEVTQQPRYIVTVEDATTDPVIVNVSIAGLATFHLAIPLAKYDGIAIIDAIERYSPSVELEADSDTCPLPNAIQRSLAHCDASERRAA